MVFGRKKNVCPKNLSTNVDTNNIAGGNKIVKLKTLVDDNELENLECNTKTKKTR
jgi:hypothetical protein